MFSQYNIASKTKEILNNILDGPIPVEDGNYLIKLDLTQGQEFFALFATVDYLRREIVGDKVTFFNNCNINFTNICTVRCGFCAFGKYQDDKDAYVLSDEEIIAKADVAVENGACEFYVMEGVLPDDDIYY